MVQMSQRGWRKIEPIEIPREEPSVLPSLIEVHREDHEYTTEDMAKVVGLCVDEYRNVYDDDDQPTRGLRLVRTGGMPALHDASRAPVAPRS